MHSFVSGKWPGARHRHECEGNITVDPVETVCNDVDWIELNMTRVKWVGFCDHVLNFIKAEILFTNLFLENTFQIFNKQNIGTAHSYDSDCTRSVCRKQTKVSQSKSDFSHPDII